MITIDDLPKYHELMKPTLEELINLGGSASLNEINDAVIIAGNIPDEALEIYYDSGAGAVLPDRFSWARSYLKSAGYLEAGGRGIWVITDRGKAVAELSSDEIVKKVQLERKKKNNSKLASSSKIYPNINEEQNGNNDWKDELLIVLKKMDPFAFERLARRILLESGFVKVEVTKKSGDGGIDGIGIMQLSLMSFHILFQCKRYEGSVGAGAVRDFRGAMMGRTDKGLIISTGTFTPDARREATRDGAPPIDLIDGELLCEKLKELNLGVKCEMIEEITIQSEWFQSI